MITKTAVLKNGFWLTLPPLLFSLGLMAVMPNALTPTEFNEGIPAALVTVEGIGRLLVLMLPAFFSIGLTTITQKRGLVVYLVGVALYCFSYGTQNFFPDSQWSISTFGFAASAYTNVIWMIGLSMLGEKFYFIKKIRYRPVIYAVPVVVFVSVHTAHTVLYHQRVFV